MTNDLYRILNVSKSATLPEIKIAYRKLAMKFHPDLNPPHQRKEVEEKFKIVTNAYNTLSEIKEKEQTNKSYTSIYTAEHVWDPKQAARTGERQHGQFSDGDFDMKAWNAWHYGEDAEFVSSVQQRKWWTENPSRHQAYYMRKKARQEQEKEEMVQNMRKMKNNAVENLRRKREERINQSNVGNNRYRTRNPNSSSSECTIS